ncbi:MAG: HNH endonuclease signature motif containing protein, partial [Oscillospiraceae bacterium]
MARDFAKKFYNTEPWLSTRDGYYTKMLGICEKCGAPGDEVHHIIFLTPENINDPYIALNHRNLQLLCFDCHKKIHLEAMRKAKMQQNEGRFEYDKEGNIVPQRTVIVWGAPASGKTSYVTKRFLPGDLMVDL